jgi:hypothetical protein
MLRLIISKFSLISPSLCAEGADVAREKNCPSQKGARNWRAYQCDSSQDAAFTPRQEMEDVQVIVKREFTHAPVAIYNQAVSNLAECGVNPYLLCSSKIAQST